MKRDILQCEPEVLSIPQAGALLCVSSSTIRRLLARGELAWIRIGRSVRVHRSSIEQLIARSGGAHVS